MKDTCRRKIDLDRTAEHTNKKHTESFNKKLDTLEQDATIPDHQRQEILKQLFPNIIYKVIDIVPVVQEKDYFGLGKTSEKIGEEKEKTSRDSISTQYYQDPSLRVLQSDVSSESKPKEAQEPSEESIEEEIELKEGSSSSGLNSDLVKILNTQIKPQPTLYSKFFAKSKDAAAIWRKPKDVKAAVTAEEIANTTSMKIAKNFVEWANGCGLNDSLTAEDLLKMFSTNQGENKFYVRQEETYSVPGQVGWYLGLKRRTRQWVLVNQIRKDKQAYEFKGEKNIAFGKTLPHFLYKGTSNNDSYTEWLATKIPKNIESFEEVFKEIKDLEVTKKYAEFIENRPYIKPPSYLVDAGLINYPSSTKFKTLKGSRRLTRTETIYTLVESPQLELLRYDYDNKVPVMDLDYY
ncbi:unnamed protein product [Phyllotreta striolata]|uniref:Uncharacterized protein n=1 Tax=Phyllotreta striolata TaxID=444603 RepID=A0A9N9XT92_PHYSR|nr:unnamed protein product [Phyllotreta striolata]